MFHGEGILAVTKALLQSGVSYVGGYQGAPVSHMMDVLNALSRADFDFGRICLPPATYAQEKHRSRSAGPRR